MTYSCCKRRSFTSSGEFRFLVTLVGMDVTLTAHSVATLPLISSRLCTDPQAPVPNSFPIRQVGRLPLINSMPSGDDDFFDGAMIKRSDYRVYAVENVVQTTTQTVVYRMMDCRLQRSSSDAAGSNSKLSVVTVTPQNLAGRLADRLAIHFRPKHDSSQSGTISFSRTSLTLHYHSPKFSYSTRYDPRRSFQGASFEDPIESSLRETVLIRFATMILVHPAGCRGSGASSGPQDFCGI